MGREFYKKTKNKKLIVLVILLVLVIFMLFVATFVGSSHMSLTNCFQALVKKSTNANNRIIWNIRIPRVIGALVIGAGLSIAGLIMQTTLGNVMASPSTLGVSNAAVFGANLSIMIFAGGYVATGNNLKNYSTVSNPFAASLMALLFAFISIIIILALCRIKSFSPNAVILSGIAIGSIWSAATTILQYYSTDVGLSSSIIWTFGDLSRMTYKTDLIVFICVFLSCIFFGLFSWKYNALLSGDSVAETIGINVKLFRFVSLFLASMITAVCVSFVGIIGFVGIIAPHIMKRILGQDHRYLIPASILSGSLLLLIADTISRTIGNGSALPVGAITSLIGAPFFLYIIFSKKGEVKC